MSQRNASQVIDRFNAAFQRHDASLLDDLIAEDCVIENSRPAPDGQRYVGRQACLELWSGIATTPQVRFDLEGVTVADDRAIILWKMWNGGSALRGVNLMRVRDGLIVEALGYVKGQ
jgi:hypothetical protein